jgi:hypothetical protein
MDHGPDRRPLFGASLQRQPPIGRDLSREGIPISRDRVRHLMRRNGLHAIFQKPGPLFQVIDPYDFPACGSLGDYGSGSGVGHRHYLHPAAVRLSLPGGDRGSCSPGSCAAGSSRASLTRSSAWRLWRLSSTVGADRRSFTLT